MEYLSHIISNAGVSTDPSKVTVMVAWLRPHNVKGLRGFLRLTDYYRWFVKDYGVTITELLKKDGFNWDSKAEETFCKLKQAMSEVPILGLPNFNKPFTLETDVSANGIGVVLVQEGGQAIGFS